MEELLRTIEQILVPEITQNKKKYCLKQEETEYQSLKLWEESHQEKAFITYLKKKRKSLYYKFYNEELDLILFLNKKVENVTKLSDYFIFYPHKDKFYVFVCELKTTNTNGVSKQVQAAEILAKYIVAMAIRQLNFRQFDVEYRALIFSTSNTIEFDSNITNPQPYQKYDNDLKYKHLQLGTTFNLDNFCY
jgi:hypothetical protein